jgi:DNA-binding PadR family transcriptional regulator
MKYLTRKEEMILLAVLKLDKNASLVNIRKYLTSASGQNWSVGNVYVPLDRMSKLDYLETRVGDPTAKRGGKAVKFYRLTRKGKEALIELKKVHERMWAEVPVWASEK